MSFPTKIAAALCIACLIGSASCAPMPNVLDMVDPQMRFSRASFSDLLNARMQSGMGLNSESDTPKRSGGNLRNCFFSPVQCLLPVQRNQMLRRFGS